MDKPGRRSQKQNRHPRQQNNRPGSPTRGSDFHTALPVSMFFPRLTHLQRRRQRIVLKGPKWGRQVSDVDQHDRDVVKAPATLRRLDHLIDGVLGRVD